MKIAYLLAPLAAIGLLSLSPASALAKKLELDANHSYLAFTASTVIFDVEGRFTRYKIDASGDVDTGADGQIRVEIETKSVDTGNKARDKHLQSDDFFASAKHPKIIFSSKKITKEGNKLIVVGVLDLHGVQRELTIPFTISSGINGAGVKEYAYKAEIPIHFCPLKPAPRRSQGWPAYG